MVIIYTFISYSLMEVSPATNMTVLICNTNNQ